MRESTAGEIERSVRIDAGFRQRRLAEYGGYFCIGPRILQKRRLNLVPEPPIAEQLPPIEAAQRPAELHELAEMLGRRRIDEPVLEGKAQRVDDDRRIPEPVKEIVGVGVVGGEDRRRQHRSWPRNDALPETGALLDETGGRDCAQHRVSREARFAFYPAIERGQSAVSRNA